MYARSDQIFDKQHEELNNIGNEMVDIKSEILCLSEHTKVLKETTKKSSSKIFEHYNHIYNLPI